MPLGLVILLQAEVSEGHTSNQNPRDANHAPPHSYTYAFPPGASGQ